MKSPNKPKNTILKQAETIVRSASPRKIASAVAMIAVSLTLLMIATAPDHPSSFTVMITNLKGNSGGSGSIIETSSSESKILTNAHVCEGALSQGGKIRKVSGEEHKVTGYYLSDEHDLCVLTVAADLKDTAPLASSAPDVYSDAIITGHPALLPNIITRGHFGGRLIVEVMTGARKCTEEEKQDPKKGPFCELFGVIPVIKAYEAMVVSATIMPGSSGSAILNSSGRISGVAFAGSGTIGYALAVPYESVRNFLSKEMKTKQKEGKIRPWDNASRQEDDRFISRAKAEEIVRSTCERKMKEQKKEPICDSIMGVVNGKQ